MEENCLIQNQDSHNCSLGTTSNVAVDQGVLTIKAPKQALQVGNADSTDGHQNAVSAARLTTKNKGDWQYGRFEIRAKLPSGQGLWPSVRMLPTDNVYKKQSSSVGIDIVEGLIYERKTTEKIWKIHSRNTCLWRGKFW